MTARFTLEMPEELLARVDEARGDVPRNRWLRRAVEQALGGQQKRGNAREAEERDVVNREPSKPAERPLGLAIQQAARSSRQAKEFKPYPKKGK